ncbi:hypothetical protein HY389_00645 [Candidatus Daviesbacteria bacterium]|nr:hypothetical protein [Candidatus Daviesbacteria bacterium]
MEDKDKRPIFTEADLESLNPTWGGKRRGTLDPQYPRLENILRGVGVAIGSVVAIEVGAALAWSTSESLFFRSMGVVSEGLLIGEALFAVTLGASYAYNRFIKQKRS